MSQKLIKFALIVWTVGLSLLLSPSLQAQVAGGTLSGTITDASGAVVPTAEVVIKNSATGITTTVKTNTEGIYTAPNLLPGSYEVAVSAAGFDTEIKKGIVINVGSQPVFNLVLEVGVVVNRVEVSTDAPTVQLTSSEISATVNATTVRELPLNGRSWTDLAALQPGVSTIQTQPSFSNGSDRGNRGFGQQLTISGARPQQSNYSAEYGKTSGGVVNAITRSGTNAFHGSVYEFLRNSALDTRNFFEDPTKPKASFKRNQFGGAIGGRIIKNRTFFFADYEGVRYSKGIAYLNFVPSLNARNGQMLDSNGNPIPVDPAAQKYLQRPTSRMRGTSYGLRRYRPFLLQPNA